MPVTPDGVFLPRGINLDRSFQTMEYPVASVGTFTISLKLGDGIYGLVRELLFTYTASASAGNRQLVFETSLPGVSSIPQYPFPGVITAGTTTFCRVSQDITAGIMTATAALIPAPRILFPPSTTFIIVATSPFVSDTITNVHAVVDQFYWDGTDDGSLFNAPEALVAAIPV